MEICSVLGAVEGHLAEWLQASLSHHTLMAAGQLGLLLLGYKVSLERLRSVTVSRRSVFCGVSDRNPCHRPALSCARAWTQIREA